MGLYCAAKMSAKPIGSIPRMHSLTIILHLKASRHENIIPGGARLDGGCIQTTGGPLRWCSLTSLTCFCCPGMRVQMHDCERDEVPLRALYEDQPSGVQLRGLRQEIPVQDWSRLAPQEDTHGENQTARLILTILQGSLISREPPPPPLSSESWCFLKTFELQWNLSE